MDHTPADMLEQAWSLVVQHPALCSDTQNICRLLCVSSSMRQTIATRLEGQLQLALSTGRCTSMGSVLQQWLPVHAELLHSLRFQQLSELDCSRPEQQQQVACMAAGLQAAAAARGARPLQLSSLSCDTCCKLLLEVLPVSCSAITHLELGPFCSDVLQQHLCSITTAQDQATRLHASTGHNRQEICNMGTNTRQHSMQPMNKAPPVQQQEVRVHNALASLPHLHSLVLFGFAANTLLATLPACTQLQRLELQNLVCSHAQWLHSLPAQLKALKVSVDPDFTSWQRKQRQPVLTHLTALTALSCTGEGLFAVQADEVLPPSLVRLVVSDCPKAAPLLALKRLQALSMTATTMHAQQLEQLPAALPALREVQLGYDRCNMESINAAAPGWPSLCGRLQALDLRVYPGPMPATTLQEVARLGPNLTRLTITGFSVQVEATPAAFAAMLMALSGLKELKLAFLRFQPPQHGSDSLGAAAAAAEAAAAAALRAAMTAVVSAAAEAELNAAAAGGPLGSAPAAVWAAREARMRSLTRKLGLHSEGMDVLMQSIAALPTLNNLSLHSMALTGAPVAALAAGGSGLTSLQLNECDLCDADVALLAGALTGLQKLALNWNFGVRSEGLACLSGLRQLRELHVCCGTTRHEAALADLKQRVPGLGVVS